MWELQLPAWELVIRAAAIYLAVLVALRLFGKREVGQFTLIVVNRVIALARANVPFVQRLVESPPTELARDGAWVEGALTREELSVEDVTMALREHGLTDVSEVKLAVLEGDGMISVVPLDPSKAWRRRRPRARIVRRI